MEIIGFLSHWNHLCATCYLIYWYFYLVLVKYIYDNQVIVLICRWWNYYTFKCLKSHSPSFKKCHGTLSCAFFFFLHIKIWWFYLTFKLSNWFCWLFFFIVCHIHCADITFNSITKGTYRLRLYKITTYFILCKAFFFSISLFFFFFNFSNHLQFQDSTCFWYKIFYSWQLLLRKPLRILIQNPV